MSSVPLAVSAAELAADRWVVLRPADTRWRRGWQAGAVLAVTVVMAGLVVFAVVFELVDTWST